MSKPKGSPESWFSPVIRDGYQLCARCGHVVGEGEDDVLSPKAIAVPRTRGWAIYTCANQIKRKVPDWIEQEHPVRCNEDGKPPLITETICDCVRCKETKYSLNQRQPRGWKAVRRFERMTNKFAEQIEKAKDVRNVGAQSFPMWVVGGDGFREVPTVALMEDADWFTAVSVEHAPMQLVHLPRPDVCRTCDRRTEGPAIHCDVPVLTRLADKAILKLVTIESCRDRPSPFEDVRQQHEHSQTRSSADGRRIAVYRLHRDVTDDSDEYHIQKTYVTRNRQEQLYIELLAADRLGVSFEAWGDLSIPFYTRGAIPVWQSPANPLPLTFEELDQQGKEPAIRETLWQEYARNLAPSGSLPGELYDTRDDPSKRPKAYLKAPDKPRRIFPHEALTRDLVDGTPVEFPLWCRKRLRIPNDNAKTFRQSHWGGTELEEYLRELAIPEVEPAATRTLRCRCRKANLCLEAPAGATYRCRCHAPSDPVGVEKQTDRCDWPWHLGPWPRPHRWEWVGQDSPQPGPYICGWVRTRYLSRLFFLGFRHIAKGPHQGFKISVSTLKPGPLPSCELLRMIADWRADWAGPDRRRVNFSRVCRPVPNWNEEAHFTP